MHVSRAKGARRACRLDAVIVIVAGNVTPVCGVHARFALGPHWRDERDMLRDRQRQRDLLREIQCMVPDVEEGV